MTSGRSILQSPDDLSAIANYHRPEIHRTAILNAKRGGKDGQFMMAGCRPTCCKRLTSRLGSRNIQYGCLNFPVRLSKKIGRKGRMSFLYLSYRYLQRAKAASSVPTQRNRAISCPRMPRMGIPQYYICVTFSSDPVKFGFVLELETGKLGFNPSQRMFWPVLVAY